MSDIFKQVPGFILQLPSTQVLSENIYAYLVSDPDRQSMHRHYVLYPFLGHGIIFGSDIGVTFAGDTCWISRKKGKLGCYYIGLIQQPVHFYIEPEAEIFAVIFKAMGICKFLKEPLPFYIHTSPELFNPFGLSLVSMLKKIRGEKDPVSIIAATEFLLMQHYREANISIVENAFNKILSAEDEIHLGDLAKDLKVNRQYLHRGFKNYVGLSFNAIVSVSRFFKTIEKIRHGVHQSFSHVAIDSGYYDKSHINHEFKKLTGLSPSSFRKKIMNINEFLYFSYDEPRSEFSVPGVSGYSAISSSDATT